MELAGFVFRDLDEALAAFQLGPARFRCWVCGRTHRSGSKAAEACAARVKEAPAPLVGLDAADLDDAGIRSETAAEVCAPWLRLAPPRSTHLLGLGARGRTGYRGFPRPAGGESQSSTGAVLPPRGGEVA